MFCATGRSPTRIRAPCGAWMTDVTAQDQQDESTHETKFAHVSRGYYPTIVALFTATLLISNVAATKGGVAFFADSDFSLGPLQILPIITDGGFFLFPLAYVLGDVLSEVYGFKATRRAIYLGFGALILAAACFWIAVQLPSAEFYENQAALETVVGVIPRLLVAGLAAYLVGQLLNSLVLVMMKKRMQEKHLWARLIGSTVVANSPIPSSSVPSRPVSSASAHGKTSSTTCWSASCGRRLSRFWSCRSPTASSHT